MVTIVFENGDRLALDAAFSQEHTREVQATENPVEDGSTIADHLTVQPYTVMVAGLQSYTPIPESTLLSAVPLANIALGLLNSDNENHHLAAFTRLEQAVEKRELVSLHTGIKVYRNMAMSFKARREVETGFDIPFELSFREIRFAVAKTTAIPKGALGKGTAAAKKKTQAHAAPTTNKARVTKTQPSAPQKKTAAKAHATSVNKSWLATIIGK